MTARRPNPNAVVTFETTIGRARWRQVSRPSSFAVLPPSRRRLAIQFVTCRLEAIPSVKHNPGSAIVTIVNGRPEYSIAAIRAPVDRPTGVRIATVVRHLNRSIPSSTTDATTTVSGTRSRKSPHDSRLRSALITAVPATADAETAGFVSRMRRTSETRCCRTVSGVDGPVCSLIRRENTSGDFA